MHYITWSRSVLGAFWIIKIWGQVSVSVSVRILCKLLWRISHRAEWWCHLDAGRRIWGDSWYQIRSNWHDGLNGKKIPIQHSTRKKEIMVNWGASGYETEFIRMTASCSFISSDENVFSWYSGKPMYLPCLRGGQALTPAQRWGRISSAQCASPKSNHRLQVMAVKP